MAEGQEIDLDSVIDRLLEGQSSSLATSWAIVVTRTSVGGLWSIAFARQSYPARASISFSVQTVVGRWCAAGCLSRASHLAARGAEDAWPNPTRDEPRFGLRRGVRCVFQLSSGRRGCICAATGRRLPRSAYRDGRSSKRRVLTRAAVLTFSHLFAVRGNRPGKQVQLQEYEIKFLCTKAREIFINQPILLELEAPIKICGALRAL